MEMGKKKENDRELDKRRGSKDEK
jgi:hypothetical protein